MNSVLMKKEGPIGYLILNRPKQRNALSIDMMNHLKIQLEKISKNEDIKVVIIKANGPDFCAGHDLRELIKKNADIDFYRNFFSISTEIMKKLHLTPQPVIAQVQGVATAAGCQLVAACDLAVAEKNAKFATPGVKIGLFCITPMIPLCRLIGQRRALDMLLTGRFITSKEAERFGLINKIVESNQLEKATEKFAMEIAKYSSFTLKLGKKAFYQQIAKDENNAYQYAIEEISKNCLAKDAQEGMKAQLEKRKPVWKNQ